jgi:hypothetical protein
MIAVPNAFPDPESFACHEKNPGPGQGSAAIRSRGFECRGTRAIDFLIAESQDQPELESHLNIYLKIGEISPCHG